MTQLKQFFPRAPEADHKDPTEATGADVIPETAPQEPLTELTSQLASQAIISESAPELGTVSEKLRSTKV